MLHAYRAWQFLVFSFLLCGAWSSDTRNYFLASTGCQEKVYANPFNGIFQLWPVTEMAPNVDVVYLHLESYGVPWDVFASATSPPSNWDWTIFMQNLSIAAQSTGKPVSIGLLIGRNTLSDNTVVGNDGTSVQYVPMTQNCFDFSSSQGASYKTAYIRFVTWMVALFKPVMVNVAVETNLFLKSCPAQWNAMVAVEQAAYNAVKSINASIVAFPSIQLDTLYNGTATGFDTAHYNLLKGLKRDRFAVSAYPYGISTGQFQYISPSELPDDYLTRGGNVGGEITLVAETGWNSFPLTINFNTSYDAYPPVCLDLIASSNAEQSAYMDYLFRVANSSTIELIVWWSFWDLNPEYVMSTCYPNASRCDPQDTWCLADDVYRKAFPASGFGDLNFKSFGAMGLKNYNNTAKDIVWNTWEQALSRPYTPKPSATPTSSASPTPPPTSPPSASPTPSTSPSGSPSPSPTPAPVASNSTGLRVRVALLALILVFLF